MSKSGPRIAIVLVLLLGLLIFGGVVYAWNTATDIFLPVTTNGPGKTIPIEITKGETTAQIADDFVKKGLIRNALAFRVWARIKGLDTGLEAGIYKNLNTSMSISEIIDQLLNAQPDAVRVVIPEGWRIEQMAQRFASPSSGLLKFNEDQFLLYTEHIDKFPDAAKYPILKLVPPGASMEGLLFPASYEIAVDATARDVVNMMLQTMESTIQQNHLDTLASQHHMSVYQMLTLASIVEREIAFDKDRSTVASVYWNRLFVPGNESAGFLDADPTVQYARDTLTPPKAPTPYWSPLPDAARNIVPDSPWNTYTHKGLPPTPICSPGLASMEAAAAPPKTDYFYFLATKDGHIVYARTYAEFQQDEQKYLQS
jgi:UPF0755 protein